MNVCRCNVVVSGCVCVCVCVRTFAPPDNMAGESQLKGNSSHSKESSD